MSVAPDIDIDHGPVAIDAEEGALSDQLGRNRPERSLVAQVLVGFLLVFLVYSMSPNADGGDGYLSLPSAHSLLYEHDLDLHEFSDTRWYDKHYGISTVDERTVNYFPWMSAAFSMPVVAAWDALSNTGAVPNSSVLIAEGSVGLIQVVAGSLLAAAAAVAIGLLTRRLFTLLSNGPHAPRLKGLLGDWSLTVFIVVIGLGTSLWSVASRSMGQHATSMFLGAGAMLILVHLVGDAPMRRSRVGALLMGVLLALAYWARPTNALVALVAVGVLSIRRRDLLVPLLVGSAVTHLGVVVANLVLIGRALPPYFAGSRVGWHDEYLEAVAGNLVSPGRGLFVFSPFLLGALLLCARSRRWSLNADIATYAIACGIGTSLYLLVVAGFGESWWAGLSFGPRFMSETVVLIGPLALLGLFGPAQATPKRQKALGLMAGSLIAVSVLFHMGGAVTLDALCWNNDHGGDTPPGVWAWSDPQFMIGPTWLARSAPGDGALESCDDYRG